MVIRGEEEKEIEAQEIGIYRKPVGYEDKKKKFI